MLVRDTETTEPNFQVPRCCVPGCSEVSLFGIWGGRRLCLPHVDAFKASELSWACSDRGAGPTPQEWAEFLSGLAAKERAA